VVLLFIAFYTSPFSSKHFLLGLFVRSLSTQLFFLVFLLLLLLSMIAFSYVGFLSLFWVRLFFFRRFFLSHLPPSTFLEWLSSEQFAELGSVQLLAFSVRVCSLAFLSLGVPFTAIFRAVLLYLKKILSRVCSKTFLSLVILLISAVQNASFFLFQLFKRLSFQGCFVILSSFFRVCSKTFLSLVIVLI